MTLMESGEKAFRKGEESISRASMMQLGAKAITVLAQLVFTAILARLLTPDEYGIVAVMSVFVGFFSILADSGISTAVIQYAELTKRDHDALFFLSVILALVLSAIFVVLSFLIAYVYQDRMYVPLGFALAPAIVFNALNMVPNGILLRDKQFRSIAVRLIFSTVVSGVATILFALQGFGVYAIAMNSVFAAMLVFLWNELHVRLVPRPAGCLEVLKRIGKYSAFRFGDQFVVYFASNLDSLLCGRFFGPEVLGYYNKAYTLAGMPSSYLISTITSTLHPFFSDLKDCLASLWARFRNTVKVVSILSAFCCVQMFVCSRELVLLLFGDQWIPAIPLLQILSFWIYPRSINSVHAPLLLGVNRSDLLFLSTSVNTCITAVMIVLGIYLGDVEKMALCVTIAYFLEMIVPIYLCVRVCFGKSIVKYMGSFVPEVIASIVSLTLAVTLLPVVDNGIVSLAMKFSFITITFFVICLVLRQGKYIKSALLSLRR